MSIDDESILSAFLDGELDAEERRRVESVLDSDPRLAEELRALSAVRDLIAGLPREPGPIDVSDRVARRLASRSPGRARWMGDREWAVPWRIATRAWSVPRNRAVARLGAAAVLLVAGLLAFSDRVPVGPRVQRPHARQGAAALAANDALPAGKARSAESAGPAEISAFEANDIVADGAAAPAASSEEMADPSRDPRSGPGPSRPGDLAEVRRYLDNPNLKHVFLVDDSDDGWVQTRVASVIEETTRFHYFKITVAHGLVIDPRRPDEAAVFALVVDSNGLESLRGRLRAALNDRVHENPVDPRIATQLAEIDQVREFAPHPVADVTIPRNKALAILAPEGGGTAPNAPETRTGPADRAARESPTREQYRSAPIEGPFQGESTDRKTLAVVTGPEEGRHSGRFVVLVWVSHAPRAG